MASSQHPSPLPQSRRHPLKPGGQKESELIRYLDQGVNRIQKRVDNRVTNRKIEPAIGEPVGYGAFWEVARDLEGLVDVVWVSGSPNLQIPYLLNMAVLTVEFLPLFGSSSRSTHATFRLLSKLDFAFSSLLTGQDFANGETLPGFEHGRSVSTTDKVRLKGVVDRTRLTVVRVLGEESVAEGGDDGDDSMTSDTEGQVDMSAHGHQGTVTFEGFENNSEDEYDDDWEERSVASVYEKTIGTLGDVLGGPPIGIITDDWATTGMEQQKSGHGFVETDGESEALG
ncbi:hypothetical protein T440DRAFT_487408 [Plenodomus tracheiphilus IPT5]|uniref:Uncharacterized protein n=1 Tax=Plenodomus tracheiphilus IPT5 TaxID=1408161 RepID=A0A6A7BDC5_9PLEO|nr:hypothetical protein T440DRAFT_487408 [Plenodomus tracheiphilus IPT5]